MLQHASMEVNELVRTVGANPHLDPAAWRKAGDGLLELDVPRAIARLPRRGSVRRALALLLAFGHAQARCSGTPLSELLSPPTVPKAVWSALGVARHRVLRIVAAATRCDEGLDAIVGHSEAAQRMRRETWAACFGLSLAHALELEPVIRDHDVLILGETGTGKELVARALQLGTAGPDDGGPAPDAALNVAAMPEALVESELFGHAKGAFTGATAARLGRIRSAHLGSLFLDEVGDLPASTQVKLLRVIETNVVNPLGSDRSHPVDVRYLAATHANFEDLVADGQFRQDLYQRLAGSVIRLPPLRERATDLVEIGMAFVERYQARAADADQMRHWLQSDQARGYFWPGNVRELQNVLRDLMLGLQPRDMQDTRRGGRVGIPPELAQASAPLRVCEDWYLRHVLERQGGNIAEAARVLEVDRSTLYRRLRRAPTLRGSSRNN